MGEYLTIALAKGNILKATLDILSKINLPIEGIVEDSRNMVFTFEGKPAIKYIICRPTDVPAYVEHGAADLGIVGKDVIEEQGKDLYELMDLGFGYCRFVVAVPEALKNLAIRDLNYKRVATKFPHVAERYFRNQGLQVEVVKLHGNIELAPLMGLSDVIVDIVSTGRTLKENNLFELVNIMESTSRLISNKVSYRMKNNDIQELLARLEGIKKGGK